MRRHSCKRTSHGLRNEITTSKLCSAKRPHKSSRSHRLLTGDVVEVPLPYRNHECNEEHSRALLLERCISLRNPWGRAGLRLSNTKSSTKPSGYPLGKISASRTWVTRERRPLVPHACADGY